LIKDENKAIDSFMIHGKKNEFNNKRSASPEIYDEENGFQPTKV